MAYRSSRRFEAVFADYLAARTAALSTQIARHGTRDAACPSCGIRFITYSAGNGNRRCLECEFIVKTVRGRAMGKVQRAIRRGEIPKPNTLLCEDCGVAATCYDHRDYSRPLDVSPVCSSCNRKRGSAAPFNQSSFSIRAFHVTRISE